MHNLLDFTDIPEQLRRLVNDYKIYLVEVKKFKNTELFKTDLKQIFDFIRVSENRDEVTELVQKDVAYQEMEEDAYDMIAACTDSEELLGMKKYRGKDGKVNMCGGLRGIMEEGEEKFAALTEKLIEKNRMKDLKRAIKDKEYRERLYEELEIR